jgi:hypothetical protein
MKKTTQALRFTIADGDYQSDIRVLDNIDSPSKLFCEMRVRNFTRAADRDRKDLLLRAVRLCEILNKHWGSK